LQACDFVFHQQLATLQFHNLEIVYGRVCSRFDYFYFKRLMSSFQLRKMCCAGKRGNPLNL
jgi:hypothetical protein